MQAWLAEGRQEGLQEGEAFGEARGEASTARIQALQPLEALATCGHRPGVNPEGWGALAAPRTGADGQAFSPVFTMSNRHLFALGDRLKQFDSKGDPIHITPIVLFPFTRPLNRHGLTVLESYGFPLDGRSPTSRPLLRGRVPGDNLCLLVQRSGAGLCATTGNSTKAALLTAHSR